MNEEQINAMEAYLEDIPQEVKDFIFGEELASIKKTINTYLETEEQKVSLSQDITFFLLGGLTKDELIQKVVALPLSQELRSSIWNIIQEKVIQELLSLIEVNVEIDREAAESTAEETGTANSDTVLAALGERLNKSSVIAPSKRDYSVSTIGDITPAAPKAFDPYRELPEK